MAPTVRGSWGCPGAAPAQHSHPPRPLPQPGEGTTLRPRDSPLGESLRARGNFPQLFVCHVRPNLPRPASPWALHCSFNKGLSAAGSHGSQLWPAVGQVPWMPLGHQGQHPPEPEHTQLQSAQSALTGTSLLLLLYSEWKKLPFILQVRNPYVLNLHGSFLSN